jgi:tRNA-splicing ligase RtcB
VKTRDLVAIGIPAGPCADIAKRILQDASAEKREMASVLADLKRVAAAPTAFVGHGRYGALALRLLDHLPAVGRFQARSSDAPYRVWGCDLESEALKQMKNACKLPVAVSGALMPDAHVGYGLPIGGVLATAEAVIPYAVGVDIACRMKLSVLDLPVSALTEEKPRLTNAL